MTLFIIGALLFALASLAYRKTIFSPGFLIFALVLYPPVFYGLALAGLLAMLARAR